MLKTVKLMLNVVRVYCTASKAPLSLSAKRTGEGPNTWRSYIDISSL